MLAIVIPYYKISFFDETLASLSRQTDKRFVVYIGDDASADSPLTLIEKYKNTIAILYHRFDHNIGGESLVKQWERCIALSNCEEWLMILGDDDYLSDNYVEAFYKNLPEIETAGIKVIRFASKILENGQLSHLFDHPKLEKSTDFFYRKFLKSSRGSLSEQIFSRAAYNKHGFRDIPLAWGTDNLAWLDFTEFGDIYSINEAIAYIRMSSENISRHGYLEDLKMEVDYDCFTLVLGKHLKKFRKEQRLPLLKFYEKLVLDSNKVSFGFWFLVCRCFLFEKEPMHIIKFTRRILIYIKRKKL